jgi:prepilin-type N-terminal cleavage/methylation domain-containing protein
MSATIPSIHTTQAKHRIALRVSSICARDLRGFSLVEMLVVVAVIGIVLTITDMGGINKLNTRYYATRQENNNKQIANALLQYAKTSTTLGTLPLPYAGGGYHTTVYDPSNSTLAQIFRSANMAPTEINDDGTNGKNVRVYQVVQLTQSTPLDFQSGPLTTLTYQYGEVHQTACQLSIAACNVASIPGSSTAMTALNYKTWNSVAPDLTAEFFSTLPMQKQMLSLTSQRLNDMKDKFAGQYRIQQISAAANDTTNWYPYPYAAGVPGTPNPNLSGANALTNQGCWDGWYDLSSAAINVLAQLGLSQAQYGKTAWGASVQYCRDYDPALRGAGTVPHFAALRFNQSVSLGISPDAVVQANNIFITF